MKIVGVTGGIACGKSTFTEYLREHRLATLDFDQLARDVVEPGQPAYNEIVREFGDAVLLEGPGSSLNRARLGERVFGDSAARRRLNQITHPRIFRAALLALARLYVRRTRVVFVEVPLLFESSLDRYCHTVVCISATREQQIERLMSRDAATLGSTDDAVRRIDAQMPVDEKARRACLVVHNTSTRAHLRAELDRVVLQRAARGSAVSCSRRLLVVMLVVSATLLYVAASSSSSSSLRYAALAVVALTWLW